MQGVGRGRTALQPLKIELGVSEPVSFSLAEFRVRRLDGCQFPAVSNAIVHSPRVLRLAEKLRTARTYGCAAQGKRGTRALRTIARRTQALDGLDETSYGAPENQCERPGCPLVSSEFPTCTSTALANPHLRLAAFPGGLV